MSRNRRCNRRRLGVLIGQLSRGRSARILSTFVNVRRARDEVSALLPAEETRALVARRGMRTGFTVGDPRAKAAGKKGGEASKRTRRALMLDRFYRACTANR